MRPETNPSVKFTYADFLHFPGDGRRHEIVDGEHYVTPSPTTKHQSITSKLTVKLGSYLERHPLGALFVAPFDVVFSDVDVVEPDLLYISRERAGVLTDKHVRGAPDLVVEILSPDTRKTDEVTKRKLYERFGVRESWIVDPELETIKVYRSTNEVFARVAEFSAEAADSLATPLLPGFSVAVADLFAPPC